MAVYEYVCRDCDTPFELRRAMTEPERDVACPSGHTNVRRKLSLFASVTSGATTTPAVTPAPTRGGCCGGGCGCHR